MATKLELWQAQAIARNRRNVGVKVVPVTGAMHGCASDGPPDVIGLRSGDVAGAEARWRGLLCGPDKCPSSVAEAL